MNADEFRSIVQETVREELRMALGVLEAVEPGYLSLAQGARYLGVTPATLRSWCRTHHQGLPFYKLGQDYRFRKSELDKWMDRRSRVLHPLAPRQARAAG